MATQYQCKNERRRAEIRNLRQTNGRSPLNGIDYLEVASDQTTLVVHFLHPLPANTLKPEHVVITGGSRIQSILVASVSSFDRILLVRVGSIGDFSQYTLQLVTSASNATPPEGIDPQLAQVNFSFWVEASNEFDCEATVSPTAKALPPPAIDYLAKDYASFRRLMLDRLALTMPQWVERSPADLGVMLVELMAYAADHLSYYQDAVATEAYLGTARKRVSIRRHARLLDYLMNDGCNARAWIVFTVEGTVKLPGASDRRPGTQLLTRTEIAAYFLPPEKLELALSLGAQVFETLHDAMLVDVCNEIRFYTWSNDQCRLPSGSTRATLIDNSSRSLAQILKPGKVLLFEEVLGISTGRSIDADPMHRHVVRLTQVQQTIDPLNATPLLEVAWADADALPFDLVISNRDEQERPITNLSVARGNVVLADAGRTVASEDLTDVTGWERLRPRLQYGPLTQQSYVRNAQDQWVRFDPKAPAAEAMQWSLRDTQPAIAVWEAAPDLTQDAPVRWQVQRDLLNSDRFARDFVVETEDDGSAFLRFGDDALGKRPRSDTHLMTRYRIGNGSVGNVGAEAIATLLLPKAQLSDEIALLEPAANPIPIDSGVIKSLRNPLPAQGGTDPESIEQVRLDAPQAFRQQQRAVTEKDYAAAAEGYPGVQRALATRRWTGSWYTLFITVDRVGGLPIDDEFRQGLRKFLESLRLAGHDIEIEAPRFVPLEIAMIVQVAPDYFRSAVKKALLDTFGSGVLPNGQLAFFHPDRFTFGQSVYLSPIVATAMQTAGVCNVNVTRFQRWGESADHALDAGQISFDRLEIPRLDNSPNTPENGWLVLTLNGGL